jgi:hypothetical protein
MLSTLIVLNVVTMKSTNKTVYGVVFVATMSGNLSFDAKARKGLSLPSC